MHHPTAASFPHSFPRTSPPARPHGILLTPDLLRSGWSYAAVNRSDELTCIVRGAYTRALPTDPADRHRQRSAAVALTNPTVCLSHMSSALMWRLPLLGPPPLMVHVMSVGPRAPGWRTPSGVRHHGQPIEPTAVTLVDDVAVTDLSRTVVDCARILPSPSPSPWPTRRCTPAGSHSPS